VAEELKPGFTTGNVRLVRRIGAGAMGAVWLADHLTLGTQVAVKFISMASDDVVMSRFRQEAAVVAKLKSPYIVQVLDRAATSTGTPYMVLELVEGETLGQHLQRNKSASFELTRRVVDHVGRALSKAHTAKVIHRDIKPENIFIGVNEEGVTCKLFDFGIAKQQFGDRGEALTTNGSMVGTPGYMSPEQFADSSTVDEHADMWSFAVVAYHCLIGRRPFAGIDLVELVSNILRGNHIPPSQHRDDIPLELDEWFARAFRPTRDERFPDAAAMSTAFLKAFGDLGRDEPKSDEVENTLLSGREPRGEAAETTGSGADSASGRTVMGTSSTLGGRSSLLPAGNRSRRTTVAVALGAACLAAGVAGFRFATTAGTSSVSASAPTPATPAPETSSLAAAPSSSASVSPAAALPPSATEPTSMSAPTATAKPSVQAKPTGTSTKAPKKTDGARKLDYDHGI
jgi:serine/threonine protein kinase